MRSSPSIVTAVLLLAAAPSLAFVPPSPNPSTPAGEGGDDERLWAVGEKMVSERRPGGLGGTALPNPLAELGDMLSNIDDVVDDFFNNRMGNGEVFYGKRRYKPSGRASSRYNGGGLSDLSKIEAAREFRVERARIREEAVAGEARSCSRADGRCRRRKIYEL